MSEALHTKIIRAANHHRALVLFSGGQDSATCVAWALARFDHVETLGFDYGQRHNDELEQAIRQKRLGNLFSAGVFIADYLPIPGK